MRVDLRDREQLGRLLDAFFAYIEPQIESFEGAVQEFKERVPDIAKHLKRKIEEAHVGSDGPLKKKFKGAFAALADACRTATPPAITGTSASCRLT